MLLQYKTSQTNKEYSTELDYTIYMDFFDAIALLAFGVLQECEEMMK